MVLTQQRKWCACVCMFLCVYLPTQHLGKRLHVFRVGGVLICGLNTESIWVSNDGHYDSLITTDLILFS